MSGALSPHMKIKKGRPLDNWPGGNTPPVINITDFEANPDLTNNPFTSEYVAVATDAEQGDISANIEWSIAASIATQGLQGVDLGGVPPGGNASGLANDATVYTATVDVDGAEAPQAIAITGTAAQTMQTLLDELNADTTGATWTLAGNGLICRSDSTGISSSINLVDTNLFSTVTGFSSVEGAVNGVDQVDSQGEGFGGTPSLSFLVQGLQTIEASITDGFGVTVVDTETITVSSP